jgi:hypothetical protein
VIWKDLILSFFLDASEKAVFPARHYLMKKH